MYISASYIWKWELWLSMFYVIIKSPFPSADPILFIQAPGLYRCVFFFCFCFLLSAISSWISSSTCNEKGKGRWRTFSQHQEAQYQWCYPYLWGGDWFWCSCPCTVGELVRIWTLHSDSTLGSALSDQKAKGPEMQDRHEQMPCNNSNDCYLHHLSFLSVSHPIILE